MKKVFLIIGLILILIGIFFTQFTIEYKQYSQEELEIIYNECEGVPNHYFFDKDAFSYGVRCFDIDSAMSYIYGDCDKILKYEETRPLFFKRLYRCSNTLEISKLSKEEFGEGK